MWYNYININSLLIFIKQKTMKKQIKKIIILSFGTLFIPLVAFAGIFDNVQVGLDASVCVGTGPCNNGNGGSWNLVNQWNLPEGSISNILGNLLFWLLTLFGIIGIIGFVISGIIYLISAGETTMIDRAKTAMKWSIVGIIVGLSGFLIMQAVAAMLSGASSTY
jgi:hypothetical protein